ncbi:MAG: phosphoribosylformylglycinamidine synthase subunit PurL [Flavobacteriales bacterium]|nr:phosphoribosylformylglycinamidine synthase subunit PurL [Flavobacteriales bacterium]
MGAVAESKSNIETAQELGLTKDEFAKIIEILGREPNFTELSIFSVMWSEHCSYKNSIVWLKKLPRDGDHLLVAAGEENAGLVDIGDGIGCCFKIESHNHPSAVEPYQGAATGVGGINRDIFTMGARPIAQLNSLRFGDITLDRTKWLIKGVVKGIGDYGNAFGIPVLGGEVVFDPCYNTNPLVNAMSVGIMSKDDLISATSHGAGNPVFIVGSSTGKDGIHGATFASGDITEDSANDLPSVQVGDPFQEKLLMEASLEIAKTDAIIGMQDMGAAGITCSTTEMSDKGGHGMRIDLDKVPTRQEGMVPFEILLSESQERMLVVVKKGQEKIVNDIFDKWDLNCVEIGEVTEGNQVQFFMNGELVADVPASDLVLGGGAPVYERDSKEPAYFAESKKFDINSIAEPDSLKEVAAFLTGHYNIASKKWVIEQYDSMVGTVNMSTNNPSDAGVAKLKGSDKAIAMTVDCNARYVYADPEEGCAMAVAEAARNIVCTGGAPSAVTNCLNFGNPYNPEVFWQFSNAIMGMKKACEKFNTPVTGGNVSFYNQITIDGKDEAVFPTPTIGMIGVIEDKKHITSLAFKEKGDLIYLLGDVVEDINCSEYLYSYHNVKLSPAPHFDLEKEALLQDTLLELIKMDMIASAHDCADGGLYITLLEKSMPNGLGFDIITSSEVREDAFMFGESQGRVVVSISRDLEDTFLEIMEDKTLNFMLLGHVTQGKICVDDEQWAMVEDAKLVYDTSLEKMIS